MSKEKQVCSYTGVSAKSVNELHAKAFKSERITRIDIQRAAIATLMHAADNGDYTKATDLVNGLLSTNTASLVKWFEEFGGLEVGKLKDAEGKEAGEGFVGWKGKQHIIDNFQQAKCKAWWEFKKPTPWKGFDFEAELHKLMQRAESSLKKAQKMVEDGASPDEVAELCKVDVEKLQAVRNAANLAA